MTERLHISAQMCEVHGIQHIQGDGLDGGGPVNWPARSHDLSCLDFFVWGHMKSLVYASPVDSNEALVARIAVVAGEIREMPGVFANVRHFLRRRCRIVAYGKCALSFRDITHRTDGNLTPVMRIGNQWIAEGHTERHTVSSRPPISNA
ncbi:uncharacterized protein TNCV_1864541 [Trichonephila clavipes]|nr:uncharacterized protein TNCV_1864541 [Trichonephila clavipes]